jgi:hypothetical protein
VLIARAVAAFEAISVVRDRCIDGGKWMEGALYSNCGVADVRFTTPKASETRRPVLAASFRQVRVLTA